MKEEKLRTWRK